MFAEARVWARVCVRAARSVTQAHSAHGVARPLNRILEEFLQRSRRFALQKKEIIAGGRLALIEIIISMLVPALAPICARNVVYTL